jgi:hypothetical protein
MPRTLSDQIELRQNQPISAMPIKRNMGICGRLIVFLLVFYVILFS